MSIPSMLDRIVISSPSLEELVDQFRDLSGVTTPGGTHSTGTANALIALTVDGRRRPHYLELVGPDPAREGEELPETFNIHRLRKPTLITYAAHPENIDQVLERARAEGLDLGEIQDFSRTTPDDEPLRKATAALGLGEGLADVIEGRWSRFALVVRAEDGREIKV